MSLYIDLKYLRIVSCQLEGFTQKNQELFNFRCPFCGDSEKKKSKRRGFIYKKKNDLYYKCFNDTTCGTTFYKFLERLDPSVAREYSLERFREGEDKQHNYKKPKFEFNKPNFKSETKVGINLPSIKELDTEHTAKQYVLSRKIPKGHFKDLFFAEDFKKFVSEFKPDYEKSLIENDPRLIIPFRDSEGRVFAIQGRSLNGSKIRYITIKLNDSDNKVFGVDRLNRKETIYVTEGPIDSLFLENAVATADSNLGAAGFLGKDKLVLVYDNEPRNSQIVKQIERSIDENFNVCLLPESFKAKDINDAVLLGFSKPQIKRIIDSHTYQGLRAKVEFNNWKKC